MLAGKKVIISAGPTYEPIDPVRFIGNRSSGKMGFAIAEELNRRGASVTLVSGPVQLSCYPDINRIDVETAEQMFNAIVPVFYDFDIAIMCAAVADYTPVEVAGSKIKKQGEELILRLKKTKDILANLGQLKRGNQVLAGFSLETDNELENAKAKLKNKNLDFIVLNSLKDNGAGFSTDTNKITIIDNEMNIFNYDLKSKPEVAADITGFLEDYISKNHRL